jgi:multidrug efflux pump subunit AcrA (membrane-fusion protein)
MIARLQLAALTGLMTMLALSSWAADSGRLDSGRLDGASLDGASLDGASLDGGRVEVSDCVVRFADEVDVPALETGRVAEVSVRQNDPVKAGDAIARLDDRSLLIRRRSAQLRLGSAQSDAQDDVEIRYAEVALQEAEAELETSRSIQNDVRGAVPLSQIRKLRLAVERGRLEVSQAKKRTQRAQTEALLREADLAEIDDQLSKLHTDSPIDGVVLEVMRSAGEWVNKGEAVATVGRIDRLHVHALVASEAIAPASCRGLPVSVTWTDDATGQSQTLRGQVLSVDPQTLPGGRFRLHAEITNGLRPGAAADRWLLQPGAPVRMTIYTASPIARRPTSQRPDREPPR